ncbi:hypothetical protein OAM01_01300 [bacterium]|nr:hypothetical protein [bacterium]
MKIINISITHHQNNRNQKIEPNRPHFLKGCLTRKFALLTAFGLCLSFAAQAQWNLSNYSRSVPVSSSSGPTLTQTDNTVGDTDLSPNLPNNDGFDVTDDTIFDYSHIYTLTELPDWTAIEISDPSEVGGTYFVIRFKSDRQFKPRVVLSEEPIDHVHWDGSNWSLLPEDEEKVIYSQEGGDSTLHTITFTDLPPDTVYQCTIISEKDGRVVPTHKYLQTYKRAVTVNITGFVVENGDAQNGEFEFFFYAMPPEAWGGNRDTNSSWVDYFDLLEEYTEEVVNFVDNEPWDGIGAPEWSKTIPYYDTVRYPDAPDWILASLADGQFFFPDSLRFVDSTTPGFWLGMGGYEYDDNQFIGGPWYTGEQFGTVGKWPVKWVPLKSMGTFARTGNTLSEQEQYSFGFKETIYGKDQDYWQPLNYDDSWDVDITITIEVTYDSVGGIFANQ